MLKTGKDQSQGQAFHRQLLSEYITDITLDNYVHYFELKPIAKKIEKIRLELESKYTNRYVHRGTALEMMSPLSTTITPRVAKKKPDFSMSHMSAPITPTSYQEEKPMPCCMFGICQTKKSPTSALKPEDRSTGSTAVFVDPLSPLFFQTTGFAELQKTDIALADLIRDRIKLQEEFFSKLHESYTKVKQYLIKLEKGFVAAEAELRTFSEEHIRNELPPHYIPALYLKLEVILKYRGLNLLAFRKILKKFLERCACDSLELQQRVLTIDRVISSSNVQQPSLDLRGAALNLIAVYGTVFRFTYEEATQHMREYEFRTGMTARRILPNSQTFYFADAFPHHERPGSFAVRVLAGSCSLFAEKMITEVLQCPRYPGKSCGRFANGEVSVDLPGPVRGDDVFVVQSMVGIEAECLSNSGALMELALLLHSVQLAAAARITAVIPFLAYTRNVASISAVAELLEAMGCHHVITVDMHSDQVEGMFSVPMESISAMYEFVRYVSNLLKSEGNEFKNITIVAPSGEFLGRAKEFADALMRYNDLDSATQFVSVCTAVKRVETRQTRPSSQAYARNMVELVPPALRVPHTAGNGNTDFNNSNSSGVSPAEAATATATVAAVAASPQKKSTPISVPPLEGTVTPTSSGMGSVELNALIANSPVGSREFQYPHSPNSPNVFDNVTSELSPLAANAAAATATFNATASATLAQMQLRQSLTNSMHRSTSTLGFEKALRQQEEGRQSLVRQIQETRTEYKNYVLVGEAKDRLCIIVETLVDEAVKITQVAKNLHENGAERIILVATHAVMSGKSVERLIEAPIDLIIVTDSVNQDELMRNPQLARKLRVVPIAPLLARAIEKIHTENTLATLFDKS
ncbi:putative ribose-phosphate pyrophosphokinase [Leptomonas pyrrhocoris]|uniref:Putative ribose-phosphate pyrophosphokinase n=1 Tax=Leptomonas pyrrhocoris TaxID=157538 RepID=A0A0M9FRU9_LEPPY|nr:putative ribose-phosphate pyrophosphokinase [Leptomonas pyrrhocoris]XP_015653157.1 putative ribose-phosphate pyrophosphokinase [Leptomonas pyrrhocoris]KPA74717.1 putative ribose-phosphate pyrophosphokinase [Leptomonas pyrrhocoris]KPA74718.1 putative ribose-phosphate pyrophosphokinase [Leptomonas pyrrhocoris]|eukprot:XP_015653156.1 putative ribose-phosphate pyrophosphokinase [Leptomonas pyrrhocoris]